MPEREGREIFIPVVLSKLEAVAVEAACAVVATSSPLMRLPLDHPLMTGMLRITEARKKKEATVDDALGGHGA